jgi:L-amino acid N-acyltransferase YncA
VRRSSDGLWLREARADDLEAIAAIYAHYVENTYITFELEPPSVPEWRSRWEAGQAAGRPWAVAESDGELVAYAYASEFNRRPAYRSTVETTIYVRDDQCGRGIGRPLYEHLLGEAAGSFHLAVAGIALPNEASVALHEKLGFTRVGVFEEVGRKLGAWRDVGWWQRRL